MFRNVLVFLALTLVAAAAHRLERLQPWVSYWLIQQAAEPTTSQ